MRSPALVFALAKDARLIQADTAEQVVKAALALPPGGSLTVVGQGGHGDALCRTACDDKHRR
ncbi:hypothetical protein ACFVFQ_36925 [Streptomyces sp. NPDC057743]|uniref:hypothetical protein n=1 Tax=Streptomyces sp. NPDC057743 TaxID=3346236 RepID=UPI0036CF2BF9